MSTLLSAYAIAWAAVAAYVVWLGVQNARLAHRLDRLQIPAGSFEDNAPSDAVAA